jgi:CheY-like chemotaxis protein
MKQALELKSLAKDHTILYAEDNENLRNQTSRLLKKFFKCVYVAENGAEGLELFAQYRPKIVITDLRMPVMEGFAMCEQIKKMMHDVKIIITTAHDEREHLLQGIHYGVFQFLKKPLVIEYLLDTLVRCIQSMETERHAQVFGNEVEKIFNYQSNLLALLKGSRVVFANPKFLTFFGVPSITHYQEAYPDFGKHLLPHEGFLYNQDDKTWFDQVSTKPGALFHTKLKNHQGQIRHCILGVHTVPGDIDERIFSFSDVTELGLLESFKKGPNKDVLPNATLWPLLESIKSSGGKVSLLNFYRGLTIANEATILEIKNESLVLKSSYYQLKIIKLEGVSTLRSELLPKDVRLTCDSMRLENQSASFKDCHFIQRSASERKFVRVEPDGGTCIFTHKDISHNVEIVDISNKAAKFRFNALPAGMEIKNSVDLALTIPQKAGKITITCKGWILRIDTLSRYFLATCMMELSNKDEKTLLGYIPIRQMELIREFKSL